MSLPRPIVLRTIVIRAFGTSLLRALKIVSVRLAGTRNGPTRSDLNRVREFRVFAIFHTLEVFSKAFPARDTTTDTTLPLDD